MHRLPAIALILALPAAAALAADPALPDLERGIVALEQGRLDDALGDLQPLAQRGYSEAQIRLARLYVERGRGDDLDRAIHWYWTALPHDPARVRIPLARALLDHGSATPELEALLEAAQDHGNPDALPLRLRLYVDHPQLAPPAQVAALAREAAQGDTVAAVDAALRWYRDRLDDPDLLDDATTLCARWLQQVNDCYAVLARSYRMRGDLESLEGLIAELRSRYQQQALAADTVDRTARRLVTSEIDAAPLTEDAYRLFALVAEQLPEAKTQMGRLLIDDATLAADTDAQTLLRQAMAAGDERASYYLGRLLMEADSAAVDPQRAFELLREASAVDPAAHFYLGRLLDRGYLGRPDKAQAAAHYLLAARSGYAKADLALAQMYWNNEGVRVDPVNAYCFARLAFHAQVPGSRELIAQLHAALDPLAEQHGQHKAEAEFSARELARNGDSEGAKNTQLAEAVP
jgi:alginate biosynthesis protein AlgK